MGLFDQQGLFGNDPQQMSELGLIASLFSARQGDNIGLLLQNHANQLGQMQQMKRADRQAELSQLQGSYSLIKAQEFQRMMAAQSSGQPYTPNPMIAQIESRLSKLVGAPPLSNTQSMQQTELPSSIAPQPSQSSQSSQSPQPQRQQENQFGGPAGGMSAQYWLAADPSGKSYLQQVAKDNQALSTRYGIFKPDTQNPGRYQPVGGALPQGALPYQWDSQGNVDTRLYPGQAAAAQQMAGATASGSAAGRLPFETPTVVNTPGAPTLMTPQQQIEAATRQPVASNVSAQQQGGRNEKQLSILQSEFSRETDPSNKALIQSEINALQGAQTRGDPFSSHVPGLRLQDQGQSASQKELGQKLGGQAADVFSVGASSVLSKRMLSGMSDMAKSYTPGILQPLKSRLAQYAISSGMSEDEANRTFSTNTGDIQGLTSAAIQMAGKLTRQTDAQPSQLQFLKILESMPSAERSAGGLARIVDYLNSVNDYNIEKMVSMQQWLSKNNGDPAGFEASWAREADKNQTFVWNNKSSQQSNAPANLKSNQSNVPANLKRSMTETYLARKAIKDGAPTDQVRQMMIDKGYDPTGL